MSKVAVIAGVGPGLGASLVRKFAREGYKVGMLARSADFMQELAAELEQEGHTALALPTDITDADKVKAAFAQVRQQLGPVDILINHAGNAVWKEFAELTPDDFEKSWRICAYGSFLCCQEAVGDMLESGGGTMLFTGATSSIRGRAGALAFSSAKFAVRGLTDSLARELWPKGIHVAHVLIDGWLATPAVMEQNPNSAEPMLDSDAVADAYWALAQQDRQAWTFEIEMRPYDEEFFV